MRGPRVPAAALRLLRLALPACVIAATCVAALGLFRVVGRTATQPASDQTAALSLGAGSGAPVALPTHTPTPTPSPMPRPSASETPTRARLTAPVMVYNASGVSGLAGRTAALLRLRGVNVASIGNLSTALEPSAGTAVYYAPGIRSQAEALANLVGVADISPAPAGLSSAGTLVLVLTDPQSAALTTASAQTIHGR